jgi:sulfite reductase (NADPH) flavoprotein alpha-component
MLARPPPCPDLTYGLLALGDHTYKPTSAASAARSTAGCSARAPSPCSTVVEVDNGDAGAIRHWQHQLGRLTGSDHPARLDPARL